MKTFAIYSQRSISLNDFLRAELPSLIGAEISNSKVRRLIISGNVSVNGKQIRLPSFSVHKNSTVEIAVDMEKLFFEKQNDDIAFELSENDILFEDDSIIVVNKPAHFPTEAGMVKSRDNLHAAVVRFLFARQKIEHPNMKNPPYVGIMHRLDRDTSGVILFTKSRTVNAACHAMFEEHTARKVYEAVACVKNPSQKTLAENAEFTVEFPLGRISPKGQAAKWGKVSEERGGLASKTEFTVLKRISEKFVLVECRPLTGRTHQIRVHLASAGLPILGDTLYGGFPNERILLHARSLTFPHPVTSELLKVECPPSFQF